jgi:hypothetical protein
VLTVVVTDLYPATKLLRNPRPEELAGMIKKSPSEARDLLFKYIPGYREPTQEEILSSEKVLWKTIALGITLPSKNDLFKRGIIKAVFIRNTPQLCCGDKGHTYPT